VVMIFIWLVVIALADVIRTKVSVGSVLAHSPANYRSGDPRRLDVQHRS
jgi:hypothetical protein